MSEGWQDNALLPILARWGRRMPISVLHLLPQYLWSRCGLALHTARLGVPAPLRPNSHWACDLPDTWAEPDPSTLVSPGTVPVPVIELQPRWLAWWARLITGGHHDTTDARVLLANDSPRPGTPQDGARLSAREQVERFRSLASPPALRLATLLSPLPVHLDVARLIQRRFVPEATTTHLHEVVHSSLLYRSARQDAGCIWNTDAFVFPDAVREMLLNGARRSETASVVKVAAEHFGERIPVLGHLRDAVADPDNTPDLAMTRENAADIALEIAVLRALSGPYLSRADRLRNAVEFEASFVSPTESIPESIQDKGSSQDKDTPGRTDPPTPASDNMPPSAERLSDPATSSPMYAYPASDVHSARHSDIDDQITAPEGHALRGRVSHERRPEGSPAIRGNVPPRNPNFTGRKDLLEQLGKRLTVGGTTAVLPSALHGVGGMGKTQIATEYIYRHLQDYDVTWWIAATREMQIRVSLTELARQLGLLGTADASPAVGAVREALWTGQPYRRWLLVFDAAESPEEVRSVFPGNGPGEVLITSRNTDWAGVARAIAGFEDDLAYRLWSIGRRVVTEVPKEQGEQCQRTVCSRKGMERAGR